ncbi:MAG: hypothetical protein KDA22_05305 [Phycisphaerales bacterium]|nr:hypothetical protein [Phycisphaerales bacterium]
MTPMLTAMLVVACLGPTVDDQQLQVSISPAEHSVAIVSRIATQGPGPLVLLLSERMAVDDVTANGRPAPHRELEQGDGTVRIEIDLPAGTGDDRAGRQAVVELVGHGRFEADIAAGERPGQIHNFSVDAHVGPQGVFLSDGSAWHPRPLDERGRPVLHRIGVEIEPVEGWAFVASGDPANGAAGTSAGPLDKPCWSWRTPRPIDGLALVGNQHELHGIVHETNEGPVEIVMHVPPEHARFAPMYLDAAATYLDLYVPLLGRFPYRRFSIVENFFSSGFAYPGFTLLGPQVVAMAPRSLVPGYLDHELLHNWWGNGVYVSPTDGNWCEALASFGANYWRRVADDGPAAGRAYRRDLLMKLSTDPEALDDGPLGSFGSADPSSPGPNRFVGYDKGAFVLAMLDDVLAQATGDRVDDADAHLWASLRRFAEQHLGQAATWADLQAACEAEAPDRPAGWLDGFFRAWVREHTVPSTIVSGASDPAAAFAAQIPAATGQAVEVAYGTGAAWWEIDPDFRVYRVLPEQQLVPTIAGTTGPGGLRAETAEARSEVQSYLPQLEASEVGENLVLIGTAAIARHRDTIDRTGDPIVASAGSFTVGGKTWTGPNQSVLHSMHDPDHPGRYITVFSSNGDAGWGRLRLIRFYSRDTTIVWDGDQVVERRTFEPDRRVRTGSES